MKLVYLSLDDPSLAGGKYTRIRDEIDYFSKKGYEVSLVTENPKGFFKLSAKRQIVFPKFIKKFPSFLKILLITPWLYFKSFFLEGLFIAHDPYVAFPCLVAKKKVILVTHGPLSYEVKFFKKSNFLRSIFAALVLPIENYAYKNAADVIVVSEFEERFVRSSGRRKIHLIRNWVDTSLYNHNRRTFSKKTFGIPNKNNVVIFVGRLVPKNGPKNLFDSIPYVLDKVKNVSFIFVGDGLLLNEFKKKVKKLGIKKHVVFTGARNDVYDILPVADIYSSHTSSLVEGIGIVVLEAMSAGLPVIVGRDKITSKILRNGYDSLLIEKDNPEVLANEILKLLRNKHRCKQLGNSASTAVMRNFSKERQLKKLEEIYRGVK
jgi:glycosyltransferase involved in cell wall biosynthesis